MSLGVPANDVDISAVTVIDPAVTPASPAQDTAAGDTLPPPAPRNVMARAVNASALWVGWKSPPPPQDYDVVTLFHVRVRLHDDRRSLFGVVDSGSVTIVYVTRNCRVLCRFTLSRSTITAHVLSVV